LKSISFKDFNGKETRGIYLSDIVSATSVFFSSDKKNYLNNEYQNINITITDGLINVHDVIGRIARIVIDSKNMKIVEELMNMIVGKSGIEVLQKTIAILYYSGSTTNLNDFFKYDDYI
jgi:hypothetical protein